MENISSGLVYKSQVMKVIDDYRDKFSPTGEVRVYLNKMADLVGKVPELEVCPIKASTWNEYPKQKPEGSGGIPVCNNFC